MQTEEKEEVIIKYVDVNNHTHLKTVSELDFDKEFDRLDIIYPLVYRLNVKEK